MHNAFRNFTIFCIESINKFSLRFIENIGQCSDLKNGTNKSLIFLQEITLAITVDENKIACSIDDNYSPENLLKNKKK